jgi:hypothetical protein
MSAPLADFSTCCIAIVVTWSVSATYISFDLMSTGA